MLLEGIGKNDRARFYNSQTGRFISEDPIGADTNLYRYARNSPVLLGDPYGYQATSLGYGPPVISGPGTTVNVPYSPPQPSAPPSYFPYGDYYTQQLISWAAGKGCGELLGNVFPSMVADKLCEPLSTPYERILPPEPNLSGVACSIGPGSPTIIRRANPYEFQVINPNGTFNGSFIP